jgi:hypothetical protein
MAFCEQFSHTTEVSSLGCNMNLTMVSIPCVPLMHRWTASIPVSLKLNFVSYENRIALRTGVSAHTG